MLSHPCISGINPTWLWSIILLLRCSILFASILLSFTSRLIRDTCLQFSLFYVVSLSGFGITVVLFSQSEFRRLPHLQLKKKKKLRIQVLVLKHHQGHHKVQGFSLLGEFSFPIRPSYQLYIYSDFLYLCDLILVGFVFLGIFPFYLCQLICWHKIFHSTLLQYYVFLQNQY